MNVLYQTWWICRRDSQFRPDCTLWRSRCQQWAAPGCTLFAFRSVIVVIFIIFIMTWPRSLLGSKSILVPHARSKLWVAAVLTLGYLHPGIRQIFWHRDKWPMWKNIRALYVWIWPSLESSVIPLWRWSIGHICEEEIFKHSGLWCLVFPQFLPSGLFVDKEENCVERRTILNLVEMYVIASDLRMWHCQRPIPTLLTISSKPHRRTPWAKYIHAMCNVHLY